MMQFLLFNLTFKCKNVVSFRGLRPLTPKPGALPWTILKTKARAPTFAMYSDDFSLENVDPQTKFLDPPLFHSISNCVFSICI